MGGKVFLYVGCLGRHQLRAGCGGWFCLKRLVSNQAAQFPLPPTNKVCQHWSVCLLCQPGRIPTLLIHLPWCCGRRVLSKPLGYGWRAPHAAVLAATLAVDARRRYQFPYRSPLTTTERVLIVNDSAMKGNRSVQHVCDLVSVARLPHLASSLLATQPRGERANKEPLDGHSPRSAIVQ